MFKSDFIQVKESGQNDDGGQSEISVYGLKYTDDLIWWRKKVDPTTIRYVLKLSPLILKAYNKYLKRNYF